MKTHLYIKQANRDGTRQLYISVSLNGRRTQTSLGLSLTEQQFDNVNKALAGENVKLDHISQIAHDIYAKIVAELQRTEIGIKNGFISPYAVDILSIINLCKGKDTKEETHDLKKLFIRYTEQSAKAANLTESTSTAKMKILNSLLEFGTDFKTISTSSGLEQYAEWLQENDVSNGTVKNYVVMVKTFLKWCAKNGFCSKEFDSYSCNLKTNDRKERAVIYLTIDEINRFANMELSGEAEIVRDIFLFQCYTGLRISDAKALKWYNINGSTINLSMKKTGVYIANKMPEQAIEIIEKYKGIGNDGGLVFPSITKDTYSKFLRMIGEKAGLDELITITDYRNGKRTQIKLPKWQKLTSHVARKTFVVNSLSMGFTANQVIKCTGHASITSLLPYTDITDSVRDDIADKWSSLADKPKK